MKALVVYESLWGNTEQVAHAVADGLANGLANGMGDARVAEVHDVSPTELEDLDLLVVGGPTHAFSMSRPSTRQDAARRGARVGAEDRGIREWLAGLPEDLVVPVATFDTRVTTVRNLPGSAAKGAGKELKRHHHARVIRSCSFYVDDTAGPLLDGELERAASWGTQLAALADSQ